MSVVFDDNPALEHRLANIKSLPGVGVLKREYRGSNDPGQGDITDQAMRDMLAEVLVLDFLVQLEFSNIRKESSTKGKARPDITASRGDVPYVFEVTRKREIVGWEPLQGETMFGGGLEDCDSVMNQNRIRNQLAMALTAKDRHLSRCLAAGTITESESRVVVLKTSDFGFAECIDQAAIIASQLFSAATGVT